MDSCLSWLKRCWYHSGGRMLAWKRRRKANQDLNTYWKYQYGGITRLPRVRSRSLTIARGEHSPRGICLNPPGSRLLSLPAEIRLFIWEYALGGNLIAVYRENKRLTHELLDDTNSKVAENDFPIHVWTIRSALGQLPGSLRKHRHRPNTLKVLPLLQSCRLIYSEGINLLYSQNTFVFLQNQSLPDLYVSTLPERFACIRSIHLHWQFRETVGTAHHHPLWHAQYFSEVTSFVRKFTKLDNFTIFIQGPLRMERTYREILSCFKNARNGLASSLPEFFVLRLPNPTPTSMPQNFRDQSLDEMTSDSSLPFQVIRPSRDLPEDAADSDTGLDFGWRHGLLFLPPNESHDGSSELVMRSYTVWTPTPPGTRWPSYA